MVALLLLMEALRSIKGGATLEGRRARASAMEEEEAAEEEEVGSE